MQPHAIPRFSSCVIYFYILGRRTARDAYRHFGRAPGVPHSKTAYVPLVNVLIIFLKISRAAASIRVLGYSRIWIKKSSMNIRHCRNRWIAIFLFFNFFLYLFCYWNKKFFTKWSIEIFHYDYGSNWQYLLFKYLCFLQASDILYR